MSSLEQPAPYLSAILHKLSVPSILALRHFLRRDDSLRQTLPNKQKWNVTDSEMSDIRVASDRFDSSNIDVSLLIGVRDVKR